MQPSGLPGVRCAAVIVAAGNSTRMGGAGSKLFLPLAGRPVLAHTLAAFDRCGCVEHLVIVCRAQDAAAVEALAAQCGVSLPRTIVPGGETRMQSVRCGLDALPAGITHVAVHDGARPLIGGDDIRRTLEAAVRVGAAVLAVRVKDTIKQADGDAVAATLPREALWSAQTPQAFSLPLLRDAMERAAKSGRDFTDDSQLLEAAGRPVALVEGSYANLKITTREDLTVAENLLARRADAPAEAQADPPAVRVGQGYDVHRFAPGRPLVLGGVTIPHDRGLLGHSDADVALHALMDALLGAAGLPDIGRQFPDTAEEYAGADSALLLSRVGALVREAGFRLGNADVTIVAQRPKLAGYLPAMRARIAQALGVQEDQINLKATTEERLGFTGREEGIAAHAVCLLYRAR